MTLTDLENTVRQYLLLKDKYIVRLICAFVVATRLPIKPPWLFIVAGSSGGKSTLLQALEEITGVVTRDDFTTASFVTGMRGQEGIIQKMLPNAVLVVKDLSMIMSKDEKVRAEILGILRQLYDGSYQKSYGNGINIDWKGKMSLLAGTTTKIYPLLYQFSALGERYLLYSFLQPDRKDATRKSLSDSSMKDGQSEKDLSNAFKLFIDGINIPNELPATDPTILDDIIDLSELVTRARSVVERDFRDPKKNITHIHDLEMPMRFAKQILAITYGLIVLNGTTTLTPDDKELIYKLTLDCMPPMRRMCLKKLVQYKTVPTRALADALNIANTSLIQQTLTDLSVLGIVTRLPGKNRDEWEMKPEYRDILSKYEGIKTTEETMMEETNDRNLYMEAEDVFS